MILLLVFNMNFIIGLLTIVSLVAAYGFVTASRFEKEKKQEIKKDIAEFGQCCGLENGVCTFEPKLKKLNQIDIAAPKKDI
jgi:hypothetical protein